MPRLLKRSAIATALAAILLVPLASGVSASAAPVEEPAGDSLVDRIAEAADDGVSADALSGAVGLADSGPSSLAIDEGLLAVTIVFDEAPDAAQIAAVEAVATVGRVLTIAPAVSASVDPRRLAELSDIVGVVSVEAALEPDHGGSDDSGVAAALGAPPTGATAAMPATAEAASCRAIPVEADGPLASADARARFGVDGAGVTVGIISDSYGENPSITDPAQDVALGVLPGPGNPCGYETPVEVLHDYAGGDDEGRAMAQLVHGIAPGSRLMFATGTGGPLVMAQAISDLAAAGADIIVDDLSYGNELQFQQDVISTQITQARAQGVAYYTSAGNSTVIGAEGTRSHGLPISGWSTPAFQGTSCPDWVVVINPWDSADCLDFDPDGAADATDSFGYEEGDRSLGITLQWGEPAYGVTSDFEAQIYETSGDTPQIVAVGGVYSWDTPIRIVKLPTVAPTGTYELVVVRNTSDGASTPAISLTPLGSGKMTWREHDTSSANVRVGASVLGHAADGSGTGVAAVDVQTPDEPEYFTSFGPGTVLFEPIDSASRIPSPAYPSPVHVATPQIAALDGLRTTFFGASDEGPDGTEYRFFGTSAAAPVMAAVHALGAEYAPDASPEDILESAKSTATPLTNPYASSTPDPDVFGAGLVDAYSLLAALPAPAVEGLVATAPDAASVSATWTPLDAASAFRAELLSGDSVVQRLELPEHATRADFSGLTAETAYRVRITTLTSALAESGTATSDPVTTPRPAPPAFTPQAPAASELTPESAGGLTATPSTVTAGEVVTVTGLPALDWVFGWNTTTPAGWGWSWSDAAGTTSYTVPAETTAGPLRLALVGADGSLDGWIDLTVIGSGADADAPVPAGSTRLAATGATESAVLAGAGVLALLLGSVLVGIRLRSRLRPNR